MPRKSPSLEELIASEISAQGPLTFARFFELALYHPTHGYYASGQSVIGREGDFYTNVSVGPLFGQVLAGQFEEMWREMGQPKRFTLVEQGANDGLLAEDILSALEGEFAVACEYWIVEPLANVRTKQEARLQGRPVRWITDLDALPEFEGVHFSNELIDAFPVHLLRSTGEGWEELRVTVGDDGKLAFIGAVPSAEIASEIPTLPPLPTDRLIELRPAAESWIRQIATKLRRGFVLVIDYGFPRDQLFTIKRKEGTIVCYKKHRRDTKPLEEPGLKDITAHVDFTALSRAALAAGLHLHGFTDQYHFFIGASTKRLQALEGKPPDETTSKTLRALKTLLHPESMGTQFHYLAFSKEVDPGAALTGFQHSRDPQKELFAERT